MYARLLLMALLSFAAMYVLMYAMVNRWADVYLNVNKGYMALLMTAPMVAIELAVMGGMYANRALSAVMAAVSIVVLVVAFLAIRVQAGVGDGQFLRSMIPHHSSAILMCREAAIEDPEIRTLCVEIIESQQSEIDQMNAIRDRLAR